MATNANIIRLPLAIATHSAVFSQDRNVPGAFYLLSVRQAFGIQKLFKMSARKVMNILRGFGLLGRTENI